jgi:hypothetical protein
MTTLIEKYPYDMSHKLDNFEKYISRQSMARFMARHELFTKSMNIKGSIIECGVHYGGGVMAWAKMSATLEPVAFNRRIFGFDTFEGFPSVHEMDKTGQEHPEHTEGAFSSHDNILDELNECISEFDDNRFIPQYDKVKLIKGDATKTIPQFVEENQQLMISLLYLDFDLYEPTKVALEHFLPRMPKGAILAFDEVNNDHWPGETMAMLEAFGGSLNKFKIEKFYYEPNMAYIHIE